MYPIDFFFRASRYFKDNIAIESSGENVTYEQLAQRVNALAAALQDMDPQPGTRVGICSGNTIEHVVAQLAVLAAGKVWIPLNPRNSVVELARIIEFTRTKVVLTVAKYGSQLEMSSVPHQIALDKPFGNVTTTYAQLQDKYAGKVPVRVEMTEETLQAIKFTGGSTGVPKGVMQTYRTWRSAVINLIDAYGFTDADRNLLAAPVTHGAGTYLLPVLAKGGCHVILDEINAETVLDALMNKGITNVFMPPTLFYMVMAAGEGKPVSFPKLRHLIYGGAPMPVEKIRAAQRFFGPVIEVTYGQTEAPQIVTFLSGKELLDPRNVNSVGRASLLSDFVIMGPDNKILPAGEAGEICVRGQMIMHGYLDQPDKTAETIVDGWLHTGDLGYVDERGYLYLRGRSREVIITGGFNVYPVDVEDVLGKHPAVQEVAVFGTDDDKWGEAVRAAIHVKAGMSLTEDELIQYAKEQMGSVKAPKHVHFMEEIPRNPVGKVDKLKLKSTFGPAVQHK
ncbi:class I adenylate-forming enzyme family protein [Noviherbaspirillum sedimenti]|uniref:Long-chain fatty acid--CoA ligase n=1 Tax=Noviherbaspirillum sedimenti TaxID=2320865 RepID=A0A3A3G3Q2_9BURK|nr:AMP-binding protein [Noviherbaspirillum sedimenti]RJG03118.1 long-chain fatty acid--CoA ligase [Noviherbaspirillum sedimenti]